MRFLLLFVLISAFSCNLSQEPKSETKAVPKLNPYHSLLALYKPVKGDTLMVFSTENLENKEFGFYGKVVDSVNAMLFPKEVTEAHFADFPSLFACYQFPIGDNKIGLITRVPSVYMPSSIRLFILDTLKQTLEPSIELAEEVGDAGDALIKKSWIFKSPANKYSSLIWVKDLHDHSADEELDTIPENWDSYYLVNINRNRTDTTSQDSVFLTKKFEHLLKSKSAANTSLP